MATAMKKVMARTMADMSPLMFAELRRRLACVDDSDLARGMFFGSALDTARILAGSGAQRECFTRCCLERINGFTNYPMRNFLMMAYSAAQMMAPFCEGFDGAQRVMGEQAAADFMGSMVGRLLMRLSEGDPRQMIEHLPNAFKTAVSYGQRQVRWKGPRQALFTMKRDFMPVAYHEGVLQAVMEVTSARDVQVKGRQMGLLDAEYAISWR